MEPSCHYDVIDFVFVAKRRVRARAAWQFKKEMKERKKGREAGERNREREEERGREGEERRGWEMGERKEQRKIGSDKNLRKGGRKGGIKEGGRKEGKEKWNRCGREKEKERQEKGFGNGIKQFSNSHPSTI